MKMGKVESMQLRNAHHCCTMAGNGMIAAMAPVSRLFRATLVAVIVLLSPLILSAQEDSCSITIDENVQTEIADGSLQSIRITGTAEDCNNVAVTIVCMGNRVTKQTSVGSGTWQVAFDADDLTIAECRCPGRIRVDADCADEYYSCPDNLVTNLECEPEKECDKKPECDKDCDLCCLLRGMVLGALILTVLFLIISLLGHSWAKIAFQASLYVTLLLLILLIVFCCI